MGRPKREETPEIEKEMKQRSVEWRKFMENNKLTQKFLGELTGISRRTIQSIVAAEIIPQNDTLQAFERLRTRYEAEGRSGGRRKRKKTKEEGEF
jgi:transcriptional regulator with XRE-family HTH domain